MTSKLLTMTYITMIRSPWFVIHALWFIGVNNVYSVAKKL